MKEAALITGSSHGLGLEIAKCLDKAGKRLILTGRSSSRLKQASKELSANRGHCFYSMDLTSDEGPAALFQKLERDQVFPNVLIHNLGGKVAGDEPPLSVAILRKSMRLNLETAVSINTHYIPKMLERGAGRIIHISSDSSLSGNAAPGYSASKAAINAYVKSTARIYAKHNIMVCAVLPGIFEHEKSVWSEKKKTEPETYRKRLEEMPLLRFGYPVEIASVISDLACSNNMMCAVSLIQLTGGYS